LRIQATSVPYSQAGRLVGETRPAEAFAKIGNIRRGYAQLERSCLLIHSALRRAMLMALH
jgi:hypothetical protein